MNKTVLRAISRQFHVFARILFLIVWLVPAGFAAQPPRSAQAAAQPGGYAPSIPATQVLNPDGTLNLTTGKAGTVDLHGWKVQLDAKRGPIFSPQGPASSAWTAVGNGADDWVLAIAITGTNVYVGGVFTLMCGNITCNTGDVTVNHIARWNGSSWSALGNGVDSFVRAIAFNGSDVYVGGQFTQVCGNSSCSSGNVTVNHVAKWNGSSWSALANGVESDVYAFAVSGSDVYAGGSFTFACGEGACNTSSITLNDVGKWNGSNWSELGGGLSGTAEALVISGTDLYAGGQFATACNDPGCSSQVTVNNVARWNGSSWAALGHGVSNGITDVVFTLAKGAGAIYVGGRFLLVCGNDACSSDNVTVNNIAAWNGSSWAALGNGVDNITSALAVSGANLYVGGGFTHLCGNLACNSNSLTANRVARWDGSSWSPLGNGFDGVARAVGLYGGVVYAGGQYLNACGNSACGSGNVEVNHLAQFTVGGNFKLFLPLVVR